MPATENLRSEMEHLHGKKNVLIQAGLVDLSFLYKQQLREHNKLRHHRFAKT
jgi:hypothetical protein